MGITNPGFKFSNYFDLNYTSSRFYHQTYLAWVTLSGELNLQPVQLCRSLRHIDFSTKAKLSIFKIIFVPILTYGHEFWVMTERMRSQVQASEMRFLRRIEGVTLFNKVRSSEIRKSLNIEPLLLRIERSQLRWFGHVSRMPQERLPKQALHAKANGRRPVGRPRTRWTDYIEDLGWNRLGLRPSEMMEVMEDREVWRLNLEPLPPNPHGKAGNEERREEEKATTN